MGIDKLTGIDFGDLKYSITKAKGNDKNGNFTVDGYQVKLENGISLFLAKDQIQNGAKIIVDNDNSSHYKNNIKFIGFKNISIFGSKEKDKITVDKGNSVHVKTTNDNTGDYVIFTNPDNQNNSWKGGEKDILDKEGTNAILSLDKLEYKEKYDSRCGGEKHPDYNYGAKKFGI